MTMIDIDTLDGAAGFDAYLAQPGEVPRAAVIVIQEIFGVNEGIRRKCDALARAGYLALAPDLFWRIEPAVQLDPDIEPDLQRAFGLMNRFDQDRGVADIEATIRAARARVDGGKVGVVGYCLGGRLAYMTAARTDVDATVGYYGVGLDGLLDEKHAIANPFLLHMAGEDHLVAKDAQAAIHAGLDDHPRVTIHDYPGEDHGFAAEMGKRRSETAARLADQRTIDFFARHLG
ncbi:dienelactone hydrolase family protein [uncultured Sphingomonas sp.]|uniref:dienelactone hydrolase family protein n=1 Tax=uncultured Sphingomonas sp. TaxID=158754 RepID=UPI0035CBAB6D